MTTKAPLPRLREHKASGRAIVTLSDRDTGKRRDFYLGDYGTLDAHAAYAELLAQWQARGRTLENVKPDPIQDRPSAGCVAELCRDYAKHIDAKGGISDKHKDCMKRAIRIARQCCEVSRYLIFSLLALSYSFGCATEQQLQMREERDRYIRLIDNTAGDAQLLDIALAKDTPGHVVQIAVRRLKSEASFVEVASSEKLCALMDSKSSIEIRKGEDIVGRLGKNRTDIITNEIGHIDLEEVAMRIIECFSDAAKQEMAASKDNIFLKTAATRYVLPRHGVPEYIKKEIADHIKKDENRTIQSIRWIVPESKWEKPYMEVRTRGSVITGEDRFLELKNMINGHSRPSINPLAPAPFSR